MALTGNAKRRVMRVEGRLSEDPESQPDIDINTPSPARMYDFYLGGTHNYPLVSGGGSNRQVGA